MSGRLGYLLKRAQHALRTTMDEELSPLGLTARRNTMYSPRSKPSRVSAMQSSQERPL
jgi:hypothetical protein